MSAPTAPISRGLDGIVAAQTRLSDVRGDVGQLIYCGYDINELAGKVSYEEVVHLLHRGHLPNKTELAELKQTLAGDRDLPKAIIDLLHLVPKDTPPMFLVHGDEDIVSPPQHSVMAYLALKRAGVSAELHIYAATSHDFGVRQDDRTYATWTQLCANWMKHQGFLKPVNRP